MPYKNPADRKSPKNPAVGTKEHAARMERQRARRALDKKAKKNGGDKNGDGKDVSHNKALSKGGSNKDGYKVESSSTNRKRNYKKKK
jgi:hypothetical protein